MYSVRSVLQVFRRTILRSEIQAHWLGVFRIDEGRSCVPSLMTLVVAVFAFRSTWSLASHLVGLALVVVTSGKPEKYLIWA
jgi:hypothetical protein